MAGFIVEGNIIVQTRIDGTSTVAQDNGKEHHHRKIGCKADAHKAEHRQQCRKEGDPAGSESAD